MAIRGGPSRQKKSFAAEGGHFDHQAGHFCPLSELTMEQAIAVGFHSASALQISTSGSGFSSEQAHFCGDCGRHSLC